jgi:hypothetical protein
VASELKTVTFTKEAYRFDAASLRSGLVQVAETFGAHCVVLEESKKRLTVEFTFAVTGTEEQLANFAAAVKPGGGPGSTGEPLWEMLLGG